jgi:hypothetical protein
MKTFMMMFLSCLLISSILFSCAARPVYIKNPPPVVKVDKKPAKPFPNALWIDGHWAWKRGKYVWISGHWVKPRPGYVWVPGHWVNQPRGWVWVAGHWKRR